jgi:hypothetical protein
MKIRRRSFLKYSGGILALQMLPEFFCDRALARQNPDFWLLANHGEVYGGSRRVLAPANPSEVVAHNPQTGEIIRLQVPFYGHEVVAHPLKTNLAFTCHKWGKSAALVDFKAKKILHIIEAPERTRFFGHAAWSSDGKKIFVSAHNDASQMGTILVYSSEELKLDSQWSTGAMFPHQIRLSGDHELLVLNQGNHVTSRKGSTYSNFVSIDVRTGQIKETMTLILPALSHFAIDQKHHSYWAGGFLNPDSRKTDSLLAKYQNGKSEEISIPNFDSQPIQGELLSLNVSTLNQSLLGFTVWEAGYIGLYNLEQQKFIAKTAAVKNPKGLLFSAQEDNILYANSAAGEVATLKLVKSGHDTKIDLIKTTVFGNGSHLNSTSWS